MLIVQTVITAMPKDFKPPCELPEFPLLPCSRGFCIAVKGVLESLQNELTILHRTVDDKIQPQTESIVASNVSATAPRAALEDV